MLYIILILTGFILLYYIVRYKSTEYKHSEVFVLKNEMTINWMGGTSKPFNLIGIEKGLNSDKITIERIDKYVFGKFSNSEFKIKQYNMDDDDNF